jgi:hypothetical protein
MSYVLTAIVSMVIGSALGILMISIASVTRQAERENRAYRDGYRAGYDVGYEYGDKVGYESGYKVGIKWIKALKNNREPIDPNPLRVDVAPGPDSIRPEGKE